MFELLQLADGRKLEVADNGVKSDRAILFHHGSPLDLSVWSFYFKVLANQGIRAIAYTRPGYGESTRLPNRTVFGGNVDIQAVIDHFAVTSFHSFGWSAGGPFSVASTLLDSSIGASVAAGVIPFESDENFDWFAGTPENIALDVTTIAKSLESAIAQKNATSDDLLNADFETVLSWVSSRDAFAEFEADYREFALALQQSIARAIRPTVLAFAEDDFVNNSPWGFELSQVNKPVHIWVGDNDEFIPVPHAERLANQIRNSQLVVFSGHDHASIMVEKREEMLNSAIENLVNNA